MPDLLPLILPEIAFNGGAASVPATRKAYDLHALLPVGYAPLPGEMEIGEVLWSLQAPWVVPAGFYGRVALAVDPGGAYCREVGFVGGLEDGHPRTLKFLSHMDLTPGSAGFVVVKPAAVTYRKGDKLIVAVETNDTNHGTGFEIFAAPRIRHEGDWPLLPGVVWNVPLNGSATGDAPPCYRSLIPNTLAGSLVRVHVPAGSVVTKASIGLQASGPDMVAAPVPLTWGGLTAGVGWSDWIRLPQNGMPFLVNLNVTGPWRFKNISPAPSWYSDADSHASAAMLGSIGAQATRTHCVDCVQVQ